MLSGLSLFGGPLVSLVVSPLFLASSDRLTPATRRVGVVRRTAAVNRQLLGSPLARPLYLALWVPDGLVAGCESLFIPYGNEASAGRASLAGWLFAAASAGMMTGDLTIGRFVSPTTRDRIIEPLLLSPVYAVPLQPRDFRRAPATPDRT